jgi:alginate O-acetyltransferase complex protein AlgI
VLKFFAYLSLFPQLVAGPIVRARDFLHQLDAPKATDEVSRYRGLELILHGYFKKTVIADNLAPLVNAAFSAETPDPSSLYWWLVMVAFSFQIYCDFSGYSDIARGLAKWMGYDFMVNFNHPYTSLSLREFWTRWHISLSTWFRDYVYIPLGGSRRGRAREAFNFWATMLLSGLWHGASWNFVIWGGIHAGFASFEKILRYPAMLARNAPGRLLAFLVVSVQVLVAWVFFRAQTLPQALDILRIMFSFSGPLPTAVDIGALALMGGMAARELYVYLGGHPFFRRPAIQTIALAFVVWAIIFLRGKGQEFIYFQF